MDAVVKNVLLHDTLNELETLRKEVSAGRIKSYFLIFVGIGVVLIAFALSFLVIYAAIVGGIILLVGLYFSKKAGDKFSHYRHDFKQRVIGQP